jgi:hypothetical protein
MSNFTTKVDFLRQIKNFTGLTASNTWNLTGNTITSSNFIGSLNDEPLKIKVNNSDKIRIDNEGLIIGNSNISETGVTNTISILNGINPTSGNTNSVLLYSKDIEGSNSSGLVIHSENDYVHEFGNRVKLNSGGGLVSSTDTLLSVDGGLSLSISATTDSVVNLNDDIYTLLCDASSNAITINLPSFTSLRGKIIIIKKVSNSNFVTITPTIFEDIDGLSNIYLYKKNDYVMLQSPGNIGGFTGWKVISKSDNNLIFSQTGSSTTVTATVAETSLLSVSGVGSLTIPANAFQVGDTFTAKIGGIVSAANAETLTIRLKTDSIVLGTDTISFPNTTTRPWQFYVTFIVRQIGGAGVAQLQSNGIFTFNNSSTILGGGFDTLNNTTFNTTVSNTLNFTVQWGSTNASNSIYSTNFYLTKE